MDVLFEAEDYIVFPRRRFSNLVAVPPKELGQNRRHPHPVLPHYDDKSWEKMNMSKYIVFWLECPQLMKQTQLLSIVRVPTGLEKLSCTI